MVRPAGSMNSILLFLLLSISMTVSISFAGNKEMVEKDVQELDRLNKKAVGQIPDLPRRGKIEIEADIRYEKGEPAVSIVHKKIKELNKPYSVNSTEHQQDNPETTTSKKPDLIKEGTNYEVEP